jgi:hypothetical protein
MFSAFGGRAENECSGRSRVVGFPVFGLGFGVVFFSKKPTMEVLN